MANQNILQRAQVKGTTQTIKSYAGIDGQLVVNKTTGDLHVMSGVAGSNKVLPCKQTVSQMIQKQASSSDLSGYLTKNEASNTYLGKTAKAQSAKTADSANSVPWSGVSSKPSTFTPSSHTHPTSQIQGIGSYVTQTQMQEAIKKSVGITQTYDAGSSWYRVYSDGFIIQGGFFTQPQSNPKTVTLPKRFATTDYVIALGILGSTALGGYNSGYGDKKITSFRIIFHTQGTSNENAASWLACGY